MLICGKIIIEFIMDWGFFPTIKVLRIINKNFRNWLQPLLLQDKLPSWGLAALVILRVLVAEQEHWEGVRGHPVERPLFQIQIQRWWCERSCGPVPPVLSLPCTTLSRGSSNTEVGRLEIRQVTTSSVRKQRLSPPTTPRRIWRSF